MSSNACEMPQDSKCPMGKMSKLIAQYGIVPLRVVLGIIFIGHGLQKAFGLFGGPGIDGFAQFLGSMGLQPAILHAYLAAYAELIGGLLLLLGMYTRFAALAIAGTMVVAIVTVHLSGGLFAQNNGFEYPLTILAACIALMGTGGGPLSVDAVWKGLNQKVKDTVAMD